MEHEDKRIIEEIRDLLINHEEPYEEGSWEIFCEKYIKEDLAKVEAPIYPFVRFWKYAAVAAVIIFMLVLSPLFNVQIDDTNKGLKIIESLPISKIEKKNIPYEKIDVANIKKASIQIDKNILSPISLDEERTYEDTKEAHPVLVKSIDEKELVKDWEKPIPKPITIKKNSFDDLALLPLGHNNDDLLSESKWRFGVELTSSFISDNMNLGAGLLTEFKISDKLSLATGIAYTKVDASNAIEPIGISSSTRKIGVESSIQALDIPLSVIYKVNDGLYASFGVSSFNVLTENKAYQYETEEIEEYITTNPDTGTESIKHSVVTKEFSESTQDTDFKGRNNLGYLNFSIGKKQRLFGETNLIFEPFLKVPLGSLSNEDIKLMNTGLRLKLMF